MSMRSQHDVFTDPAQHRHFLSSKIYCEAGVVDNSCHVHPTVGCLPLAAAATAAAIGGNKPQAIKSTTSTCRLMSFILMHCCCNAGLAECYSGRHTPVAKHGDKVAIERVKYFAVSVSSM